MSPVVLTSAGLNEPHDVKTPGPMQIELYKHRRWLETGNFGVRKKGNCTTHVAKTKALISFTVTAKLICASVFACAECWFSHNMAQTLNLHFILDILQYMEMLPFTDQAGTDNTFLVYD